MRWVSGLSGRQRLRILLPWLVPWLLVNLLWLCGLESRIHSMWAGRVLVASQFLLVGGILSLAWNERKSRKPAPRETGFDQQ